MCNCMIYLVIAELLRLAPTKSPQFDFGELSNLAERLDFIGVPDRIRTCDPRLRRPMLYPTELRAQYNYLLESLSRYFMETIYLC